MAQLNTFGDPLDCPDRPSTCDDTGAFVKRPKDDLMKKRKELEEFHKREEDAKKAAAAPPPPLPDSPSFELRPEKKTFIPQLQPGQDGQVNWTPLADLSGTRPAVNKYSISRYSLDEWRKFNNRVLVPSAAAINQSNVVDYDAKTAMAKAFGNIDFHQTSNFSKLRQKARDIFRWKVEVEKSVKSMTEEVELLEVERQRLKGAARTLMLPESISKECLDIRSNRPNKDLVADVAEQALIKEMNLVGEIRETLKKTLDKIEDQMSINKAAKHKVEYDWCDKTMAYNTETLNIGLTPKSSTIMFRPGATKNPEFSAPLEYWEYFCRDTITSVEAARQKSVDLRNSLNSILINGGRKLRMQADKTNVALAESVAMIQELLTTLEDNLQNTLNKIADMENLIEELNLSIQKTDFAMKLAQTRLDNRNNMRPHGESVRDTPHLGLIEEVKKIHETVTMLRAQLSNVFAARNALMDMRIELEKDIAGKRKTLSIDRDRVGIVRSHYPSALELAGF